MRPQKDAIRFDSQEAEMEGGHTKFISPL